MTSQEYGMLCHLDYQCFVDRTFFSALPGLAWDSNLQDSTFHCHKSMYNIYMGNINTNKYSTTIRKSVFTTANAKRACTRLLITHHNIKKYNIQLQHQTVVGGW